MPILREWSQRLRGMLLLGRRDADLEHELSSHVEMAAEDARRRGLAPDEASRAARMKAGSASQAMDALRDQRGVPWLDDLARDVSHGLRTLRRTPVFTAVALLTLALSAMLFSVAFRWTEVTGGENGLGGITRPKLGALSFDSSANYYILVALIGALALFALWRFHRSPVGTVLVAIRENEQRARFVGYATNAYKLLAFAVSATVTRYFTSPANTAQSAPAASGGECRRPLIAASRAW